jgi:5'-phosphate synthase pdxT subunit
MSKLVVGVLSLQGDFSKHTELLQHLGVETLDVRYPSELDFCEGLIIPGGESTAIITQMEYGNLTERVAAFAKQKPVLGTCAGLILMAKKIAGKPQFSFRLIDVEVERNAFGPQLESFVGEIEIEVPNQRVKISPELFIRAPRIIKQGPKVAVLARWQEEPVWVQQGMHMGTTFHPELMGDSTIHKKFIETIKDKKS